jgi:hypothetical protein
MYFTENLKLPTGNMQLAIITFPQLTYANCPLPTANYKYSIIIELT